MRPLPIRARLTLWYLVFLALAALAWALSSWFLLRHSLEKLTDHALGERLGDLRVLLEKQPADLSLNQIRTLIYSRYAQKDEGKWLQLVDQDGRWIYYSARITVKNPVSQLPGRFGTLSPFVAPPGHFLQERRLTIAGNGRKFYASMAESTDHSHAVLDDFRLDLLISAPLVLLIAAFAGHVLSRNALNPVAEISSEARRINDRNLATRLPVVRTGDELEDLSTTLNQMLGRIDGAFRSIRSFTANASHELRTPIALIRTRVEIALSFPRTTSYYREALEQVQRETERMTSLVDSLLALARADGGGERLQFQPLDLAELAREALCEWLESARHAGLRLTGVVPSEPVWVRGNGQMLHRLFRILIDNACRYTPAGGSICLEFRSAVGQTVVSIRDSGIGIAPEYLPHLFERFYQVPEAAHQRGSRGAGLGLSLAEWIVEQHTGTIRVESSPGAGSTFSFALPLTLDGTSSLRPAAGEGVAISAPSRQLP